MKVLRSFIREFTFERANFRGNLFLPPIGRKRLTEPPTKLGRRETTPLEKDITLPEAAVRLRLPYYTAHRLALRGLLGPVRQIAGRWILSDDRVTAYLDQRGKLAVDPPLPACDADGSAGE